MLETESEIFGLFCGGKKNKKDVFKIKATKDSFSYYRKCASLCPQQRVSHSKVGSSLSIVGHKSQFHWSKETIQKSIKVEILFCREQMYHSKVCQRITSLTFIGRVGVMITDMMPINWPFTFSSILHSIRQISHLLMIKGTQNIKKLLMSKKV